MNLESYKDAKNKLVSGDISVESFFKQNNYALEYGYCCLLAGYPDEAKSSFEKISNSDTRADWALKLIQFIELYVPQVPSYFQIRNFLEIDLNLLIQFGQAQFVENIINGADLLYTVNPESYKFIARVMLNNDFLDLALFYLDKAKEKFYYDPEMHFMLATCYVKKGEKLLARAEIRNCLAILPDYFPAKTLLTKLV